MTKPTPEAQLPPCPLPGEWRYNNGHLICGTVRIFRADFDTDPSPEFKDELTSWVVTALNEAAAHTERGQASDYEDEIAQAVVVFESLYRLAAIGHGASAEHGFQPLTCSDCALLESAQITLKRLTAPAVPGEGERCMKCGSELVWGTLGYRCPSGCDFSRPAPQQLRAIERLHVCPKCSAACLCKLAQDEQNEACEHCASHPTASAARRAAEKLVCKVDLANPIRHLLIRDMTQPETEAVAAAIEAELTKE